ncbi:MAG: hypothetical protein P4L59_12610 [Desulfosporosinus sp.]|nr:hypothetical protein [Desulfosporosinus sp.]
MNYVFPFGQELKEVVQVEQEQKDIFVLGVYASAVHAKWLDFNNRVVVQALAVASEPYIFWHGGMADNIVADIKIPKELGKLVAANSNLNGPSGKALDQMYLNPLGCDRSNSWLCDLVPHSCLNSNQFKAIQRHYNPLIKEYNLPLVNIPSVPKELANERRRQEIMLEITAAKPKLIILLGDEPIRWFLANYLKQYKRLEHFGYTNDLYGRVHRFVLEGTEYNFLPLVHPRQAAGLGNHSKTLREFHNNWIQRVAPLIRTQYLGILNPL